MKKLIFVMLIFVMGCAAISFSTKDNYGGRGINGLAIYPDVGGVVTRCWDGLIKKERKK